jgi:hypothetical protein
MYLREADSGTLGLRVLPGSVLEFVVARQHWYPLPSVYTLLGFA